MCRVVAAAAARACKQLPCSPQARHPCWRPRIACRRAAAPVPSTAHSSRTRVQVPRALADCQPPTNTRSRRALPALLGTHPEEQQGPPRRRAARHQFSISCTRRARRRTRPWTCQRHCQSSRCAPADLLAQQWTRQAEVMLTRGRRLARACRRRGCLKGHRAAGLLSSQVR